MNRSLFIFGYGYVAAALSKRLLAEGWQISGTARDALKRQACAPLGIRLYDFTDVEPIRAALNEASHLLCFIPPAQVGGDVALRSHRVLIKHAPKLHWLGYASTTGVYGDTQGGWVDEETAPAPVNQRSRLRLEAERGWAKLAREKHSPLSIFRISGIYGPGQSAIDQLRAGSARRIDKKGQMFSRIHVDDIVGIIHAAMTQPEGHGIFNLVDAEPSAAREVVEYAAKLTGLPLPPLEPYDEAQMSPMLREFYESSRRVRSQRLGEIGYRLHYPSYREGLDAYWAQLVKRAG